MRKVTIPAAALSLALALAASAAAGTLPATFGNSVLQVHGYKINVTPGATVFDAKDLFVFSDGSTISLRQSNNFNFPSPTFPALITGVGKKADLADLAQAMATAHIGLQIGGCKILLSNAGSHYEFTWFGKGDRINRFVVDSAA
ncbi:MAG TPA: hypothetical protein VOA87_19845, partial [Thermoanaerobaculia bacterium]|nr:hypothetical protein [Thermoanaerobaculia bacterium]